MATGKPEPVNFTQATSTNSHGTPKNMLIVGTLPAAAQARATTSTYGTVKQAATVAAASGTIGATYTATEQATLTNLQTQFNSLLANLKTAGVVA